MKQRIACVLLGLSLAGCPATSGTLGATWYTENQSWQHDQLRALTEELRTAFAREGAEGLKRLRVAESELSEIYAPEAAERVKRFNSGLAPIEDERRWLLFRSLGSSPITGYCARGIRVVEAGTVVGYRVRVVTIDRLLIVGTDHGERWGAWVEGILLTHLGWRLMPTVSYGRQVETPRRNHTDILLWECDLAEGRTETPSP